MKHQSAANAVENRAVAVPKLRTDIVQPDHGRQVHRPRHDRRMRGRAAQFHRQTQDLAAIERRHLGGRNVMGHHDPRRFDSRQPVAAAAHQVAQNAAGHVANVRRALPQIIVLHLQQRLRIPLGHLHQHFFDVPALLPHFAVHVVHEARIIHHLQVRLENAGAFPAHRFPHPFLDVVKLPAGLDQGRFQPDHFARHILRRNRVFRQRIVAALENQDRPRHHPRRDPDSLEFEIPLLRHALSPRRISVRTARPGPARRPPHPRRWPESAAWSHDALPASAAP